MRRYQAFSTKEAREYTFSVDMIFINNSSVVSNEVDKSKSKSKLFLNSLYSGHAHKKCFSSSTEVLHISHILFSNGILRNRPVSIPKHNVPDRIFAKSDR